MDVLNDPDLEPELKIIILLYIFAYVLPEILDKMPEICQDNDSLKRAWLLKELKSKKSIKMGEIMPHSAPPRCSPPPRRKNIKFKLRMKNCEI